MGEPPFGSFVPSPRHARLLGFAQHAPHNGFGKQLARMARALYLWRAPVPVDVEVEEVRLRCYLRDNTCERKFVFTPWRFDTAERSAIAEALPRDGVFVDVGANVGIYTLSAAKCLGAAGRIVALEPYPPAFERLLFNIEATRAGRARWPRVDALALGVADRTESRELRIDPGNLGGGSITSGPARFSSAGAGERVRVECRPLLEILAELGIDRINALKIDIEGAEDCALTPFLERAPTGLLPRRLVIENSDHLWKTDLRSAINRLGYRVLVRTRLNTVYAR